MSIIFFIIMFFDNFSQFILKFASEYIFDLSVISLFISKLLALKAIGLFLLLKIRLIIVELFQYNQNDKLFERTSFLTFSLTKAPPPKEIIFLSDFKS